MSKIEGLEELQKRLSQDFDNRIEKTIIDWIESENITEYPPQTEANRPDNVWYERGFGTRYKSGAGRKTSEDMKSKWEIKPKNLMIDLSNQAKYSNYVVGTEQSDIMREIGWPNIPDKLENDLGELEKELKELFDKEL